LFQLGSNVTNISNTYIAFVQFWRPEECYHSSDSNCNTIKQNVTIHGLWPNFYGTTTTYPSNCRSITLTESDVATINTSLTYNWPSYQEDDFDFWSHEWSTHGTCWFTQTPLSYFQTGLQYHEKYNITTVLIDNNIKLNTKYQSTQILSIFKTAFGVQLSLDCTSSQYIDQIMMCFDWNGNKINCPSALNSGSCSTQVIFYG